MKKITIQDIKSFKSNSVPFSAITAYDYISAQNANIAEIPLLLVGDSAAMVIYGMDNTIPISMDELIFLVRAVSRGSNYSLVVADMPFMSYQASVEDAIRNAGRFIKEGGAAAVKLEGGAAYKKQISAIIDAGIPVVGHVGLLPQSYNLNSGYGIQGKTKKSAEKIMNDAKSVEESGAFSIVLEGIPANLSNQITKILSIPTIGIGAGLDCDGQIQVYHDLLGLFDTFSPKHAKKYTNLNEQIYDSLMKYKFEVESCQFPDESHCTHVDIGVINKIK